MKKSPGPQFGVRLWGGGGEGGAASGGFTVLYLRIIAVNLNVLIQTVTFLFFLIKLNMFNQLHT